jgi:hypothetical protein
MISRARMFMHLHINLINLYLMLDDRNPFKGTTVKYVKSYFACFCIFDFFCMFGIFMHIFIRHIIQYPIRIYQKSKWKYLYKIKNRNCFIFPFLIFMIFVNLMNKFVSKVSGLK